MVQLQQQQSQTNLTSNQGPISSVNVPLFSAPGYAIAVNVLWFLALSLSLIAALLCLLAKEWLKHYEYHPSNSSLSFILEHQKKLDAMKRWYGFEIIDSVPILLHIALFLFGAGLVVHLWRLNLAVSLVILAIFAIVVLFYIITTVLATVTDKLEKPGYDSKITAQVLLWVYDIAGDKAADSLIEVMSTMRADWEMSILMNTRRILSSIWEQEHHLLSSDTRASTIIAELKLMFLISSCLNDGRKWKEPNNLMHFHRDSFREVITFYNSSIARATVQLMRYSDGITGLNTAKLVDLLDAIIRSMACVVGLVSNFPLSSAWVLGTQQTGAAHPGGTLRLQRDVALGKGPMAIVVPDIDSSAEHTLHTLHPIDYGLLEGLIRISFSPTEQRLKPKILYRADLVLRSVLEIYFNCAVDTSSLPALHDARTLHSYWPQDLEFVDIDTLPIHNARDINERRVLCDEIFESRPWVMVPNEPIGKQMAGQLLAIATLYILNSGPGQTFESFGAAGDILDIAERFGRRVGPIDWPRLDMWRLIRAANAQAIVNRGASKRLQHTLLRFVSAHILKWDAQTPEELNAILLLLVTQGTGDDLGVNNIFQRLVNTPSHRSLIQEHCFHTLTGLSPFLLVARYASVRKPVVDFIVSIAHTATHETQGSDPSRRIDVPALGSFLLGVNFVLIALSTSKTTGSSTVPVPHESEGLPTLPNLGQRSFAKNVLNLLAKHDASPLDNDPEERVQVHKGLLYVWGEISEKNSEPPDLSLESVKRRLQAIIDAPIRGTKGLEERADASESGSGARPDTVGSSEKGAQNCVSNT
ncbi:hypothetical protein FRC11_003698 [Ceratobasidium sp. 423]|nr:hypothetical protein FRC11_003698 [Ceratobasidium sp. 423]